MDINFGAVVLATIAQFVVGAAWYMPLFGSVWGKIHGFEKHSKKEQAEMQKSMLPWLGVQLVLGGVTAYFLAVLISLLPGQSVYIIALWTWLGFCVPTQASAVIFGGTAPQWMATKIAVMAGGSFVCLMVSAWIIQMVG